MLTVSWAAFTLALYGKLQLSLGYVTKTSLPLRKLLPLYETADATNLQLENFETSAFDFKAPGKRSILRSESLMSL